MSVAVPEMRTERLLLRGWRDADRAPFAALNADPEVMRHFPSTLTAVQSDELVDRITARWGEHGWGLWAAERLDTGELIGFIGLSSPTWEMPFTPCVEVGWRLARQHWGHGFAPEGATAALRFGFERVELPGERIVSFTTVANHKSRRVMEKLGLRHDPADDFDHPILVGWAERRHVLYRIDRRDWEAGVAR